MTQVQGGKNLYGIPVGILMLESQFPRIPGDAGNAETWPFPVLYRIVREASPQRIVRELDPERWAGPFIEAARELERAGVDLVTTNCGFLVLLQRAIQDALRVPFLSSSLLQVPWIAASLPPGKKRVGILTIDAPSLTERHLRAAGVTAEMPIAIQGMEEVGGAFTESIVGDRLTLDPARCRREHEEATRQLLARHEDIGAIVLECTNMPPYADAIAAVSRLPVYDITTLVRWAASGLGREAF